MSGGIGELGVEDVRAVMEKRTMNSGPFIAPFGDGAIVQANCATSPGFGRVAAKESAL